MTDQENGDLAIVEMTHALSAAQTGDWDTAVFRLDQARMHTVDLRQKRRPYDMIVTFEFAGNERRDWVRVIAGSRGLAHLAAKDYIMDAYDFDASSPVIMSSEIDMDSPLQ